MGRHAGFLALYVGISIGATAVLIPKKKPHAVTFRHSTRLLVLLYFLRCQTLSEYVTFDYLYSPSDIGYPIFCCQYVAMTEKLFVFWSVLQFQHVKKQ